MINKIKEKLNIKNIFKAALIVSAALVIALLTGVFMMNIVIERVIHNRKEVFVISLKSELNLLSQNQSSQTLLYVHFSGSQIRSYYSPLPFPTLIPHFRLQY